VASELDSGFCLGPTAVAEFTLPFVSDRLLGRLDREGSLNAVADYTTVRVGGFVGRLEQFGRGKLFISTEIFRDLARQGTVNVPDDAHSSSARLGYA
jgi:hypothetical protein